MSNNPLVSIIMNCYNSEQYLKEAIDSIYSQTYQNWEIIFWDNASTDSSASIAKSYDKRLRYFVAKDTVPLGKARNLALKKVSGKYIAFLDCDDLWLPHKLSKQLEIMEKNIDYKMSYGGVLYINEDSTLIKKYLPCAKSGNLFKYQLKKYEIGMQSVLIRNDIQISFNENLEFSPDYDLMMHIASKYKVFSIKSYLIKYRKVNNSLTHKKADKWWVEMKITLDKIFEECPDLRKKFPLEYRFAYAKVDYYKARYLFMKDQGKEASILLSKNKYLDMKYFLLYMLSLLGKNFWDYIHKIKR